MIHVFCDTETTGLGPFGKPERKDQIIEVAFIWREGREIKYIQELFNPGLQYLVKAQEALKIQGRTLTEVFEYKPIDKAYSTLVGQLPYLHDEVYHSWNIPFDRFFLEQDPFHFILEWGEDPMVLASRYMGYSYDRIALWKAAEYFEIKMPENYRWHTALADAYMAMRIWEAMGNEKM